MALTSPVVLVTGANQGLGLATARILASKHSYHVLVGSRNIGTGEKVAAGLRDDGHEASSIQLDLNSRSSIEAAVATIERDFGYLDVLINNAAILIDLDTSIETWDLYVRTFTTNVIGTNYLTELSLPMLRKAKAGPPRLVFLSSRMGSLHVAKDKNAQFYEAEVKAYDASKAAVNMLMLNYTRILEGTGAKVNSVCPGYCQTNLTRNDPNAQSTEVGASRIVELATLGEDGPTGTFSDKDGPVPW